MNAVAVAGPPVAVGKRLTSIERTLTWWVEAERRIRRTEAWAAIQRRDIDDALGLTIMVLLFWRLPVCWICRTLFRLACRLHLRRPKRVEIRAAWSAALNRPDMEIRQFTGTQIFATSDPMRPDCRRRDHVSITHKDSPRSVTWFYIPVIEVRSISVWAKPN